MAFWRSNSTKKKSSRKKKPASDGARLGLTQAGPFIKGFLAVIFLAACAVGWTYAHPYLRDRVNESFLVQAEVEFTGELPAVEGLRDELTRIVFASVAADPLGKESQRSLDDLRREMLRTGWFDEESLLVRRDLQKNNEGAVRDTVVIDGAFRSPFALVRSGTYDYLVDVDATRLPVTYEMDKVEVIPVIVGVRGPVPTIGDTWKGSDLTDGIELLQYLSQKQPAWLNQVREIDVSNAGGQNARRPRLVIVTPEGHRVGWGRAVGDEAGIDIPARDKIQLLDEYARPRQGKIGDPLGLLRVDLPLMTVERGEDGGG